MPRPPAPRRAALALFAALAPLAASSCGGDDDDPGTGPPNVALQIVFEEAGGDLRLGFGRVEPLTVRVEPPTPGVVVHFSMLGDTADAALDASRAITDAAGQAYVEGASGAEGDGARVSLYASSREATFFIEARLDDGTGAELGVTVSPTSEPAGTVVAKPLYDGKRDIDYWVVQVRPNEQCSGLAALTEPTAAGGWVEGLTAKAPENEALSINNLIPGRPLAILAWGGPYARGCQDVTAGVATAERLYVDVPVTNVALDLSKLNVAITLDLDQELRPTLASALNDWGAAFLSPFQSDKAAEAEGLRGAEALLQAMRQDIALTNVAGAAAFAQKIEGFKPKLVALPGDMPNVTVRAWVEGAVGQMQAAGAIQEPFKADVSSSGGGGFSMHAELLSLPFDAIEGAGLSPFGLVAESSTDRVAATGGATFNPGALLGLAVVRSLGGNAPPKFEDALSGTIACGGPSGVASALTDNGATPIYGGCDATCAAAHCARALHAMCEAALTASAGGGGVELSFAISGAAVFDDKPALNRFRQGTWAGKLLSSRPEIALRGSAKSEQK